MKKREDIVQKFSTFLCFRDQSNSQNLIWQVTPELERHIKHLAQSDPEAKAEFWARYFLKILRDGEETKRNTSLKNEENRDTPGHEDWGKSLTNFSVSSDILISVSSSKAGMHLLAYLQEACLWAAQKTYHRFKFFQHKYPIEEYFQIANSATNPPAKLLKNFNFEYSNTNIEGYVKTAVLRFISNTIYQQDLEAKREKFSDYGLLKDLNNKELKEALISKGIKSSQINSYCLAWQCLDEIYQPNKNQGSRSLNPPDQNHLQQIASCYNDRSNQVDVAIAAASGEKIQEMLLTCIQAAREHRTKRFLPLENYENLSDSMPTPWDLVMQSEEWDEVKEVVSKLFSTIPELGQTMLKLWQGLNLTQTEMATVLRNKYPEIQKQYQVARQLGKYTKNLLRDYAFEWNKINPEICINTDKELERIKEALDECLQSYCQQLFFDDLARIGEHYSDENKLLLSCHKPNLNEQTISKRLNLPLSEISNRVAQIKLDLTESLGKQIETGMGLPTKSLQLVNYKIASFVDEWLKKDYCYLKTRIKEDDI